MISTVIITTGVSRCIVGDPDVSRVDQVLVLNTNLVVVGKVILGKTVLSVVTQSIIVELILTIGEESVINGRSVRESNANRGLSPKRPVGNQTTNCRFIGSGRIE